MGRFQRNVAFWLIFTLINDVNFPDLGLYLARLGVLFLSYAPGNYLHTLWLLPHFAYKRKYLAYVVLLVPVFCGSMVLSLHCTQWVNAHIAGINYMGNVAYETVSCHFFPTLIMFLLLTLGKVFTDILEGRQRLAEIKKQQAESELLHLRTRINPHFLFNSLNTVYGMALKQSDEVAESVMQLSDVLRYVIYESEQARVPLSREIRFLEQYLLFSKHRARKGSRVVFTVKIDGQEMRYSAEKEIEEKDAKNGGEGEGERTLPPLLLLPFAENAVKYGLQKNAVNPYVEISLEVWGNRLRMKCVNTIDNASIVGEKESGGFGLQNVRRRLDLLYGQAAVLIIDREEEKYTVDLEIDPI